MLTETTIMSNLHDLRNDRHEGPVHPHPDAMPPDEAAPRSWRIGTAIFFPDVGVLIVGRRQARLRRKTVDVLKLLVEHAERVVRREELLDKAWPGVAVTDDILTQSISEIRRALGPALAPSLRTVHRRGYMLSLASPAAPTERPRPAESPPDRTPCPFPPGASCEGRMRQIESRIVQLEQLIRGCLLARDGIELDAPCGD